MGTKKLEPPRTTQGPPGLVQNSYLGLRAMMPLPVPGVPVGTFMFNEKSCVVAAVSESKTRGEINRSPNSWVYAWLGDTVPLETTNGTFMRISNRRENGRKIWYRPL